jgi:hypothetical protein
VQGLLVSASAGGKQPRQLLQQLSKLWLFLPLPGTMRKQPWQRCECSPLVW